MGSGRRGRAVNSQGHGPPPPRKGVREPALPGHRFQGLIPAPIHTRLPVLKRVRAVPLEGAEGFALMGRINDAFTPAEPIRFLTP